MSIICSYLRILISVYIEPIPVSSAQDRESIWIRKQGSDVLATGQLVCCCRDFFFLQPLFSLVTILRIADVDPPAVEADRVNRPPTLNQ